MSLTVQGMTKVLGAASRLHADLYYLRGPGNSPKGQLYDELFNRLENAERAIKENKLDLSYEILYGVNLGLDGLMHKWNRGDAAETPPKQVSE